MGIENAVERKEDVMGGALCFTGTRVPVRILFDYLEGGNDLDYFLEGFASVSRDQALAVLEFSAILLESTEVPLQRTG